MFDSPEVVIERVDFYENDFICNGRRWRVATLLKAAKEQGCEEFDLPLSGIDLSRVPFKINDIDDFIYHMNRAKVVDTSYPIILNWYGLICDGWHRVARAIVDGKKTIKAIRLKKYVDFDFLEPEKKEKE